MRTEKPVNEPEESKKKCPDTNIDAPNYVFYGNGVTIYIYIYVGRSL